MSLRWNAHEQLGVESACARDKYTPMPLRGFSTEKGMTVLLVEQGVYKALLHAQRGHVLEWGDMNIQGSGQDLLTDDHLKAIYLGS